MTTFAKILSAINKAAPRTAAQLRDDLGKIDIAALESRVAEIEGERRSLLLRGDADLDANTKALSAAKLEVERGQIIVEELERLIGEADAREADAALEAQAAEAQTAVDRLAEIYGRIDAATADLQEIFNEAKPLAAKVDAWNRAGHQVGRPRLMFTPLDVVKQRAIGGIRI